MVQILLSSDATRLNLNRDNRIDNMPWPRWLYLERIHLSAKLFKSSFLLYPGPYNIHTTNILVCSQMKLEYWDSLLHAPLSKVTIDKYVCFHSTLSTTHNSLYPQKTYHAFPGNSTSKGIKILLWRIVTHLHVILNWTGKAFFPLRSTVWSPK